MSNTKEVQDFLASGIGEKGVSIAYGPTLEAISRAFCPKTQKDRIIYFTVSYVEQDGNVVYPLIRMRPQELSYSGMRGGSKCPMVIRGVMRGRKISVQYNPELRTGTLTIEGMSSTC